MALQLHTLSKEESFRDDLTNRRFAEISVLNAKATSLKKINVSFIVHY